MPDVPPDPAAPLEDAVPSLLAPIEAVVRREQDAVIASLEEDFFAPLHSAITEAARIHRELMESHKLTAGAGDPDDARALWGRLQAYRCAVRDGVMEPLHTHLDATEPALLTEHSQTLYQALSARCGQRPPVSTPPPPVTPGGGA